MQTADRTVQKELEALFAEVRHDYFPRWRAGARWAVKLGKRADYLDDDGYCEPASRTVFAVRADSALLIHEISHAVTGRAHGKLWQGRMHEAARRARKLGHEDLARALVEEAEAYRKKDRHVRITAAVVYDLAREVARKGKPYEAVLRYVASEVSMLTEELLGRYRRFPAVFEAARQRQEAMAAQQRALAERRKYARDPLRPALSRGRRPERPPVAVGGTE